MSENKRYETGTTKYQNFVLDEFRRIFGEENAEREWYVAKDSKDDWSRRMYCPRIDVIVGPKNTNLNVKSNTIKIHDTVKKYRDLLEQLWNVAEGSRGGTFEGFLRYENPNPRVFLAVEIGNSGSRKHCLGDIANVSIIGCFGVVVPLNSKMFECYKRLRRYITYVTRVGKLESVFNNVLIIKKENFKRVILQYQTNQIFKQKLEFHV